MDAITKHNKIKREFLEDLLDIDQILKEKKDKL